MNEMELKHRSRNRMILNIVKSGVVKNGLNRRKIYTGLNSLLKSEQIGIGTL